MVEVKEMDVEFECWNIYALLHFLLQDAPYKPVWLGLWKVMFFIIFRQAVLCQNENSEACEYLWRLDLYHMVLFIP